MRLTSSIFVSALLRRVASAGGFAAVLRRGNDQAGAIFLVVRRRNGEIALYGPAAQHAYVGGDGERRFSAIADPVAPEDLERRLAREERFDSDLWAVEIEPGAAALDQFVTLVEPD